MACERCRVRKVKCDNVRPSCVNCVQRTIRCVYVNERQKRRKLTEAEIESRLHRVESLVRIQKDQARVSRSDRDQRFEPKNTSHRQAEATNGTWHLNSSICGMNSENEVSILEESPLVNEIDCNIQSTDEGSGPETQAECGQAVGIANRFHECNITSGNMLSQILSDQDPTDLQDENTAVWIRVYDGDEYTGPSSGISFLSAQGLNWVRGNAGRSQALCSIFEDLKNSVRNYLRVPKCVANDAWACDLKEHIRKPLPSTATIWTYINSYFESVQCVFPVLDRTKFESQTREYLSSTSTVDTAWYALLNAVLASGCRAALSAETADAFRDSGREGWAYFQNALAVEAELVHKATSLAATQALAVMTVYAQSISSPLRLEYTLSSTAVRLAQSIGLHRKSPSEWNLSFEEQRERNRTFWVIYCLDKTVALRCGRPCILDDADISCPFPRAPRSGQGDIAVGAAESAKGRQVDFDFFLCYARYARICGIVAKDLYSATGLSKSCDELTSRAAELLEEINTWKQTIPDDFRPGKRFRPSTLPDHVGMIGGLALHFGYSYIICAVYRRFSTLFERGGQSGELRQRKIFASSITAANSMEAARSMILMTKHLDIESYSPAWLLFYYPMTALLTIFMHVVCNPLEASARNDIALMEAAVGFFGRLEYLTSGDTAFTKTGEFVRHVRMVVDQWQHEKGSNNSLSPATATSNAPSLRRPPSQFGAEISIASQDLDNNQLSPNLPELHTLSTELGYDQGGPQNFSTVGQDGTQLPAQHIRQSLTGIGHNLNASSRMISSEPQVTSDDTEANSWQHFWSAAAEYTNEELQTTNDWTHMEMNMPRSLTFYG